MNLLHSIESIGKRVQASSHRNLLIWGAYMLIFVFVYGAMLVRTGLHWDETLDFYGGGMETYVANGRWGVLLWRHLFGTGIAVWTAGVIAGLLLTLSLVLQTRLFKIENVGLQLLYGALSLSVVQFAFQMDYFFLCDASAFALLAATLATLILENGGRKQMWIAAGLMVLSVAVYQCIVLNFFVLVMLLILKDLLHGEPLRLKRRVLGMVGICIAAVLGWIAIRIPVQMCIPVHPDTQSFCDAYLTKFTHTQQLFSSEWYIYLSDKLYTMLGLALVPFSYVGEGVYFSIMAPMVLMLSYIVLKVKGGGRKVLGVSLIAGLWLAPFSLYLVTGNLEIFHPHTKLAQPVVFAAFWLIAVSLVRWRPLYRYIGIAGVCICVVQASSAVSLHAAELQAKFEERMSRLLAAEQAGVLCALESDIDLEKGCILYYVLWNDWETSGYADFCGDYPALKYMKGATGHQLYLEQHKKHLDEMPLWPHKDSVRAVGDVVIIKGGPM